MVRAVIPHHYSCPQVADRWGPPSGTVTRGGRRKAGLEVKNLEGPLAAPRWLPRILKSSPPPASYYTKFSDPRFFLISSTTDRNLIPPARQKSPRLKLHLYNFNLFLFLRIVSGYYFLCIAPTLAFSFLLLVREPGSSPPLRYHILAVETGAPL